MGRAARPAVRGTAREVFLASLRLGLTSFGGPIAHLGYQRAVFVDRLRWLDDDAFAELVAVCQTLPGPASSQLSIAVGRMRAGWAGALAAFLGFTLPSAVLMTLAGLLVAEAALPESGPAAGAIAGLKAAAVAVVAHAVVTMGRRLAPDPARLLVAAAAAGLMLAWPVAPAQVIAILLGGLTGWIAWGRNAMVAGTDDDARASATTVPLDGRRVGGRRVAATLGLAAGALLLGAIVAPVLTEAPPVLFAAALVRAGALVFGGGHVVLPLLDAGVVTPGYVDPGSFVAGYGVAQAMPGPLFSFGAYLGAVSTSGPGGIPGAMIGTIALFLPGALLILAALPVLGAARSRPRLAGALQGVNAVVVGILAAALVTPVSSSGITSLATAAVAVVGTLALLAHRLAPLAVVAGSSAALASLAVIGVT
jgi:chromate transporter